MKALPVLLLAGLSLAALTSPLHAQFTAVATYDENTTGTNAVDLTASVSNVTLANFKSTVSTTFAGGTGGVINFDNGTLGGNVSTFNATFGTAQTLTITNSVSVASTGGGFTAGTNTGALMNIATGLNGNSTQISGTQRLGQSTNTPYIFNFSTTLQGVGFTVLSRTNTARNITVSLLFENGTATQFTAFSVASSNPPTADTFFGYDVGTGSKIKAVRILGSDFFQIDDLGFYTSAIPEPSSAAMLGGLAALGAVVTRRRRRQG